MIAEIVNTVLNRAVVRAKVRALKLRKASAADDVYTTQSAVDYHNVEAISDDTGNEKLDAGITNVIENILESAIGNAVEIGDLSGHLPLEVTTDVSEAAGFETGHVDAAAASVVENTLENVIGNVLDEKSDSSDHLVMEVIDSCADDVVDETASVWVLSGDNDPEQAGAGTISFVKNILESVIGSIQCDTPIPHDQEASSGCPDDDGDEVLEDAIVDDVDDTVDPSIDIEEKTAGGLGSENVTGDVFVPAFEHEVEQVRGNFS